MSSIQQTISPVDGSVYVERPLASESEIAGALDAAEAAQSKWKQTSISERAAICRRFTEAMLAKKDALGLEITWQMGRPIRYTPREIDRMADRSFFMIDVAEEMLSDIKLGQLEGFTRFIRHEPLGVLFAIVPWNYPYLTAVNSVVPAIMAGNSVLLKHSPQTPLCAERIAEAFNEAGLPEGVFQYLHLTNEDADRIVRSPQIDAVAFTGSVAVGRTVQKAASDRFIGVGLELGGKDPAYVRADANLPHAIENVVDGALFNSGQSCCAVERVYVHADVYDAFVGGAAALTREYVLGNPLEETASLGPMVRKSSADFVRGQIAGAVKQGAHTLIDESSFTLSNPETAYLAPQILTGVDHSMSLMRDESFGPVVGIMKVQSDEEAIMLMNDSQFGLTASVWTADTEAALQIGDAIETGTVFMNRCDYLDPELAWTGVKDSGRGCTLSKLGYEHMTRPKSYHLRTTI
jgi:acyl-CoA reductase-like NAD-dependent aldehyde dehydrogenase